jgi:hypothetical protein
MLAQAVSDVQAHYNFDVSPETTLWANLVMAMGAVYGPRIMLVYSRKQKEKQAKPRPMATVSPIKPDDKNGATFNIPGMHDPLVN